jgi:hypothetical protein
MDAAELAATCPIVATVVGTCGAAVFLLLLAIFRPKADPAFNILPGSRVAGASVLTYVAPRKSRQSANRSRLGGIFTLIAGGLGLAYGLALVLAIPPDIPMPAMTTLPVAHALLAACFTCAAVAAAGGLCALRRRAFRLALAGATCGMVLHLLAGAVSGTGMLSLAGIPGAIFVALARSEFTSRRQTELR